MASGVGLDVLRSRAYRPHPLSAWANPPGPFPSLPSMSRYAAGIAVAFACTLAWVAAVTASDAVPEAAAGVPEQPEPPKLLVLRDGKVVEGTICFAQGGYEEVKAGGGRIFVPDSMVWFTARHRREAYEQLCRQAPCRTADEHTEMARWCLTNGLHSCAREELQIALEQEPGHAGALSLVKTLDAVLKTGSPAPGPKATTPRAETDGKEALGGLPPWAAREFVTRVQPLLVNRCGNAACHGGSKNAFALRVVRPGNPAYRRLTEQNLEAVRGRLSAGDPGASPLLLELRRPGHGGARKPLFVGPAGEAQLKMLTAWVAAAAGSAPPGPGGIGEGGPSAPAATGSTAEMAAGEVAPAAADAEAMETTEGDSASDLLRRSLAGGQPDAFDPEEFNRRYGPQPDRLSSPSSQGPTR